MFNIVLVEPEIPANTGNIGRTCVVAGARLHLVRPLGFSLDAKTRRRAGLLYWDHVDLRIHDSWGEFLECEFGGKVGREFRNEGGCDSGHDVGIENRPGSKSKPKAVDRDIPAFVNRLHFATKKARKTYAQAEYKDGDYLVFGKESTGLPERLLAQYSQCCERIPMLDDKTSGFSASNEGIVSPQQKPLSSQDICGNFVDPTAYSVNALNLSNSVAIMLYEALRQTGFQGMEN